MTRLDIESRVRSYLRAHADTVPDDEVPPRRLPEDGERRGAWPIALAAAAVTAMVLLIVPLVRSVGPQQAISPAADGAPAVPFILSSQQSSVLHDGATKVSLRPEDRVTFILGRVGAGWLVQAMGGPGEAGRIGTLEVSGRFSPVGAKDAQAGTLSPDRSKVAVVDPGDEDHARLRIFELDSGKELGSVAAYPSTRLAGWNSDGIWFHEASTVEPIDFFVWRPGEPVARPIVLGEETVLTAPARTNRMLAMSSTADRWCLRVVRLRADLTDLELLREHCGTGPMRYPTLAPDGRHVVIPEDGVAIEVDSGRKHSLRDMPDNVPPNNTMFEDPLSVLVVGEAEPGSTQRPVSVPPQSPATTSSPRALPDPFDQSQIVSRCRIDSASCTPIFRTPDGTRIRLGTP